MTNADDALDAIYMRACLELAKKATGRTAPNPAVGAIVVSAEGQVVGEGYHAKAGSPHAEVIALKQAGELAEGGTLYVSLEPCCHTGRTGPCTETVIASCVRRVVAASTDPNPVVAGKGFEMLRRAGLEVSIGALKKEADWLNRGFAMRMRHGRPWICLKLAVTMDARIADRHGNSRWISGPQSRARVHQLRNEFDAVLVGGNTLRQDDPELTVRDLDNSRNPIRVVLDRNLSVDPKSRFCQTKTGARTLIFCSAEAIAQNTREFPEHIELHRAPIRNDLLDIDDILRKLGDEGINTVLCEGGGKLAGSLIRHSMVDELYWVMAPKIIGDSQALAAIDQQHSVPLTEAYQLTEVSYEQFGEDSWLHAVMSNG